MHTRKSTTVTLVALLMAGCGGEQSASAPQPPQPAPSRPALTTRQIMLGITAPTSDAVFRVAVEPPNDGAGWERIEANAAVLAASADLLKQSSLAVDSGDWMKYCDALLAAASATSQAAGQHDTQRVTDLGNQVYETCEGCHMKYFAQSSQAQ